MIGFIGLTLHAGRNESTKADTPLWLICPVCHHTVLNTHLFIGKIGPVFRPRRLPLITRFFPCVRVSTLFPERNLHLVVSTDIVEIQPLNFHYSDFSPPAFCSSSTVPDALTVCLTQLLYHRFLICTGVVVLNLVNQN